MSLQVAVRHRFGAFALDAAFEAPGGITALFGRSGSGKTTVVNAVAGLLRPEAGRIAVGDEVLFDSREGRDVPVHRRGIGYVFQDARLFPHLSVRRNLLFGRRFARGAARLAGQPSPERVIDLLGLGHLLERRPGALSGGERQRVAVGRALLSAPRALLMDEPLAALDAVRKAEIIPYLERLRDETSLPIVYVSHAMSEVARLATTLVVLDEGRVVASGPAGDILADPDAMPLVGVRAAGAVLNAVVVGHDDADGLTELAVSAGRLWLPRIAAVAGTAIRVRVAAHEITLASERPRGLSTLNVLPVEVVSIHAGAGPGAAVALRSGEDRLLARITRRSVRVLGLAPGSSGFALFKATSIAREDIGDA